MPKRKGTSVTGAGQRHKAKLKKREMRLKKENLEATPPHVNNAAAPTLDLDPNGSPMARVWAPPCEETHSIARMQAPLSEEMHSTALRLAPPQGSLTVQKDRVASPDSPAWVCTSSKVPGSSRSQSDVGLTSDHEPAGQAQLGITDELSSRLTRKKDARLSNTTILPNKIHEESKMKNQLNQNNLKLCIKHVNCVTDLKELSQENIHTTENMLANDRSCTSDISNARQTNTKKHYNEQTQVLGIKADNFEIFTVQGSLHQGDPLFNENAGNQCATNSLVALAYHYLKKSKSWKTVDMDAILNEGNKLYTIVQRTHSITSNYLMVNELPQDFECFGEHFHFVPNESIPTLIDFRNSITSEVYDSFQALPLQEALQIALDNTDGCFVTFKGNTFLVGKEHNYYFIFDPHSRSSSGLLSDCGKCTRILLQSNTQVLNHVLSLAKSLGCEQAVECDITGVQCSLKQNNNQENRQFGIDSLLPSNYDQDLNRFIALSDTDPTEVECVGTEQNQLEFHALSHNDKSILCNLLNLQNTKNNLQEQSCIQELTKPADVVQIEGDGNCFFRAISQCLTGTQENHKPIRKAICNHLLENAPLFNPFLRNWQSVQSYIQSTKMFQDYVWATEVEILALAHLIKTDIFTYIPNKWIKTTFQIVESLNSNITGAIYLELTNNNHYNLVTNVCPTNQALKAKSIATNKYHIKKSTHKQKMRVLRAKNLLNNSKTVETDSSKCQNRYMSQEHYRQKVKELSINRYRNNQDYRKSLIQRNKDKYATNEEYRNKLRQSLKENYVTNETTKLEKKAKSVQKYKDNSKHRENVKKRSIIKYKTDKDHRTNVKGRSVNKYKTDEDHRISVKERSVNKYKIDEDHRISVKERSVNKYKTDEDHKTNVKERSVNKYKTDKDHRTNVKGRSVNKYKTDKDHRTSVKVRSEHKYKTDKDHRTSVKVRSIKKYKTDEIHRESVKQRSIAKYRDDEQHREKMKNISVKKYQKNPIYQEKLKSISKQNYQSCIGKQKKKQNVKKQRQVIKQMLQNKDKMIDLFKQKVKQGPSYTCCCCNRLLFDNQVQCCSFEMYSNLEQIKNVANICLNNKFIHTCLSSCDIACPKSSAWICYTCHRKILNGNVPAESGANKMLLEDIPAELNSLNTLEQHLIALHIPFMKVMPLPQGGQRNLHGPVVCVPSDMKKTTSLPLPSNESHVLRVKLKRKLCYKGYYEYQFVNPTHLKAAISYLKENNKWYRDISVNDTFEKDYEQNELSIKKDVDCKDNETDDEKDDGEIKEIAMDTCLQPVDIAQDVLDHYFDDVYNLAPAEGKNPIRMLQEKGNEAKSFPHLFPNGCFAWDEDRPERITLARYFNNRLMNSDNRFAKDTNYIFFSQYMSELNQVIEKTQISIRKSLSKINNDKPITMEMLQNPECLAKLIRNDEAIRFMQPIRGTPAYWSVTQKDLFAMLRQLGIPTWFCSFSAAEYRWNEIGNIIQDQDNDHRNFADLDWKEKSEILKNNPVTVARMFEHRFHVFQRDVILSPAKPIGNIIDYFVRVEFQQRGSPHMHCLYWVENAPKIGIDNEQVICDFIDNYVTCAIPAEDEDPKLRQIVLDVQQHSKNHSKTCKKKGTVCRFNFPRPPSGQTFITKQDDINDVLKKEQAKHLLSNVWDELLKEENENKTTEEIFTYMNISQEMYEKAHKVVTSKTQAILKRDPIEMWTNQYNPCLLKCWDANMDIQYVMDPFSCIVYIISYISKSEREMGMLLKQTQNEAAEGNLSARQTIKQIGSTYLNHREVSCQEAVYRVCNLRMKECSRKVIFIPVGENPTRLSKPLALMKGKKVCTEKETEDEKNDDNNDEDGNIWMTNIVERYENKPDMDTFHEMCLAEFCSKYRVLAKSQIPKKEKEGVYELRNGKGYIQLRTRTKPAVVRYPRFKPQDAEKYYQSLLQLFLPYGNVKHLKPNNFDSYENFYKNGHIRQKPRKPLKAVKEIVDANQSIFSQNEEEIDAAQEAYDINGEPEDAWANLCPESERNREECIEKKKQLNSDDILEKQVTTELEDVTLSDSVSYIIEPNKKKQNMLPILRSLNVKQKKVFYVIHDWCIQKLTQTNTSPLHIFITGGAGTGKSHLIKAIQYEVSRIFQNSLSSPDATSIVLTAFTGTAAFNIGGSTIHHVFSLNKSLPLPYEPLKEQSLNTLRTKLEDLKVLVIDEISMVYKRLLYYIHQRLVQIKKCKEPFGGVTVIALGDFYQLPPVKQRKDERLYQPNFTYPIDYWLDFFQMVELDEIMRQREDLEFAIVLNSFRVRTKEEPMSREAKVMLKDCIKEGPDDVLHVYATNAEANEYNMDMLKNHCENLVQIDAQDSVKDKTTGKLKQIDKPIISIGTDGLSASLLLAENARVMLTRNIDVEDGLVNGVMGYISQFLFDKEQNTSVEAISIIFDSKDVGKKNGKSTQKGTTVQIKRIEEEIREKHNKNIVRHQFPLKLSWACTAHKVQGMTTDKIVVNIDKSFSPGQAYVAFSRVTTKQGLFIVTENKDNLEKKIYADPDVKLALSTMSKFPLIEEHTNYGTQQSKTIILFNVQSLKGHFQDVLNDSRFLQTDLLLLTETWLTKNENITDIQLPDFEFFHNPREDCYGKSDDINKRLSTAKGGGICLYRKKKFDSLPVTLLKQKNLEILSVELSQDNTVILLIYRPSTLPVKKFINSLEPLIDFYMSNFSNCIVLGDMNENAITPGPIQKFLLNKGLIQRVDFPTTEAGTSIDHVYITEKINIEVSHMPLYFSFHEAIRIIYHEL